MIVVMSMVVIVIVVMIVVMVMVMSVAVPHGSPGQAQDGWTGRGLFGALGIEIRGGLGPGCLTREISGS